MCINNNRYNQTNHTLQTNHLFNDLPFMVMKIAHWLICNTYEYEAWKVIVIKLIKFNGKHNINHIEEIPSYMELRKRYLKLFLCILIHTTFSASQFLLWSLTYIITTKVTTQMQQTPYKYIPKLKMCGNRSILHFLFLVIP